MREMSATGDLSRRLEPGRGWWYDEDAAVLAATFGSLTESIRRFQQEAVLRRRLADLGRLSTVIAHEIRNPLMIIKGALRSLRRVDLPEADRCEALSEIDDEVGRLDRIVGDVLDFARPVRIEPRPTDLNAVCVEAAEATLAAEGTPYELALAGDLPEVVTDPERVRTVLVNALSNAAAALDGATEPRPIRLRTASLAGGGARIEVVDEGVGIPAEDLQRIFEPYFTTRRTGTGLGLAICRNVTDALGGQLAAESTPGRGTTLRLELPARAPAPAGGA
jgi:signal transduction histidine kinase